VLAETNRICLKEHSRCVYLEAQVNDLWIRLRNDRERPLLQTANPRARITQLAEARHPFYLETAHVTVKTGRQGAERAVSDIITALALE
jgi:shikimate kinase